MERFYDKDISLIIIAIILGLFVGIIAVLYAEIVNFLELFLHKSFHNKTFIIFLPVIGGLIVGLLIKYETMTASGHGIPAIMETIKTRNINFTFKDLWVEGFASAITIGTGGSAGSIGPVVEIGAGFGDLIGQKLNLPIKSYQTLLGCGAAAGISAIFSAPLGGIVFVMEILYNDLKIKRLSLIIISAISADVLVKNIFHIKPIFKFPKFYLGSIWNHFFYILLGALMGLIGAFFVKNIHFLSIYFDNLSLPDWLKPALGGLSIGITALFLPQIMGTGIDITNNILNSNKQNLLFIFFLIVFKIILTAITISSGGSGGIFAPSLMIGGLTGLLFASIFKLIFPEIINSIAFFAIVGMSATFSGIAQAPLTSSIIIFELIDDYNIIIPLLASSIVSSKIYSIFISESIYSPKLFKRLT